MNGKRNLLGLPSWGLALITAFASIILLVVFTSLMVSIFPSTKNIGEGIGYILCGIVLAVVCFLICKNDSHSVWYVPVIANIPGVISAIAEPNFWITDLWIFIFIVWLLSIIGAIVGKFVGQNKKTMKSITAER